MNNTDYENLLELLKKALQFYANKDNYSSNIDTFSKISLDNGSQAKFALEKLEDFTKNRIELEEYAILIGQAENIELNGEVDGEELLKKLSELRNAIEKHGYN